MNINVFGLSLLDITMFSLFGLMLVFALRALLVPPRRHRIHNRYKSGDLSGNPIAWLYFGAFGSGAWSASDDHSPGGSMDVGGDGGGMDSGGGGMDGGGSL
jgi:hypothetical protein